MRIPSGTTDQYIYFVAVDSTDYTTRETGFSSFTVYRSRNGGAAAAMTTPTINETDTTNMPGVYELLLDEDMTIDAGDDTQEMAFHITHAGMAPVTRTIELYRPKITVGNTLNVASDGDIAGNVDGSIGGSVTGTSDVNVIQISGDATAADSLEASMETVIVGTAGTGSTTSTVANSSVTGHGDDTFIGRALLFRTGALQYEAGTITDYDSAAGTFTFAASTFTAGASNGDAFVVV